MRDATTGGTTWSSVRVTSTRVSHSRRADHVHHVHLGTTAKPKGIYHTTGGYLTHVATTHKYIFDVKPETDVCWTAADIGWITGHSYIVYGPLING